MRASMADRKRCPHVLAPKREAIVIITSPFMVAIADALGARRVCWGGGCVVAGHAWHKMTFVQILGRGSHSCSRAERPAGSASSTPRRRTWPHHSPRRRARPGQIRPLTFHKLRGQVCITMVTSAYSGSAVAVEHIDGGCPQAVSRVKTLVLCAGDHVGVGGRIRVRTGVALAGQG